MNVNQDFPDNLGPAAPPGDLTGIILPHPLAHTRITRFSRTEGRRGMAGCHVFARSEAEGVNMPTRYASLRVKAWHPPIHNPQSEIRNPQSIRGIIDHATAYLRFDSAG